MKFLVNIVKKTRFTNISYEFTIKQIIYPDSFLLLRLSTGIYYKALSDKNTGKWESHIKRNN